MKRFARGLAAVALALTMLVSSASALSVEQAIELLEQDYLRSIPAEAYEAEDLDELFEVLGDAYTYYMTAEEYQAFIDSVESTVNLVGIGVSIRYTEDGLFVVETIEGGSAARAGIRAGDLIVAVDGVSCVPANESHQALITGEEGTEVSVTVLRRGQTITYILTRTPVVVLNTRFRLVDGRIGHIQCSSFGLDTGTLFLEGVETYDGSVDCWLVDVRGNTGGYAQAAVEVLGVFAGAGPHLYLQDGGGDLYYYSYLIPRSTNRSVVVIVDGNTASAAEAFAAGVRDLGLGITVGSRTYGKGVAQIVYDGENCPDYFDGDALKITAYRFYSAAGITNDLMGVIPTLLVSDEMAPAVAEAVCADPLAARESLLLITLGSHVLAVDLAATLPEVLAALFEALPPTACMWLYEDGAEHRLTVTEAAERLNVRYASRWFEDAAESPYADRINTLATYGVIDGDAGGNFRPSETLKRGEVCAMLGKALGLEESRREYFDDVPAGDACAPYINAMAEMGLVRGTGDGRFLPNEELTCQEYYTILGRAARYLDVNLDYAADSLTREELDEFAGRGYSGWACGGAALLDMVGAILPSAGEAAPGSPILRDQAAASLHQVLVVSGILPD